MSILEIIEECGIVAIPQDSFMLESIVYNPGDKYDLVDLSILQSFAQAVIDDYKASLVPSKPDVYDMILRREDGFYFSLDILNMTVREAGIKQFTLALGETD